MNVSVASFIFGGLFVLLSFVCLFLLGAAKQAHRQMKEAQDDRLKLAELNKQLAAELARKQPLIITDEQVFKLAAMVNNMRTEIGKQGLDVKTWEN